MKYRRACPRGGGGWAPVSGEVFDLEPKAPGFVVRESEPLLKLVREAKLEASVLIQNQDIALVLDALRKSQTEGKKGVPVEVMVEAFPATEFGTVNGTLTSIGSDVLEPDPQTGRNFYAFPATIELDSDKFILDNGLQVRLHSGMAVQAKIKIGKRTVLQLFMAFLLTVRYISFWMDSRLHGNDSLILLYLIIIIIAISVV